MTIFAIAVIGFFGLLLWWAIDAGRPPKPRSMKEILAKDPLSKMMVEEDVYVEEDVPTGPPCHKCKGPIGVYYSVLLCDRCLGEQINNDEALRRRHKLGETVEVSGAMSVEELERIWANSK